jgi:exopolysaccharide biosynthesis polyprenyl glycosylphosphotransferase
VLRPGPSAATALPAVAPVIPAPRARDHAVDHPTVVLPYVGSVTGRRTRRLRAWMLTLPLDLLGFVAPLAWSQAHWRGIGVAAALTVALFASGGLYEARRHISFLDVLPSLCGRMLVATAVVGIFVAERHESVDYLAGFLREVAVSSLAVLVGRLLSGRAVLTARRRRWVEHMAIVVGGGPVATELARLLRRYPQYGLRFVGFVDVADGSRDRPDSLPVIGDVDKLERVLGAADCDVVIFADINCPEARLLEIARSEEMSHRDLWVVPRLREFRTHAGIADHIGAIPVVRVRRPGMNGLRWLAKRAFDIVFAATALVLLSPALLLSAFATWIEGGRGIFFRQERIGRHGSTFRIVKFRTMRPASEAESQTLWSVADDSRVGPVGRFLRRTSLDELPQLWNILRGDMTVVGPRPERPHFVDQFSADHPDYAMRHRVPAGLTGLAQVSGLRGDTPISDRARFDNYYIENWSLWLDLKVILRTVVEVVRGGGR